MQKETDIKGFAVPTLLPNTDHQYSYKNPSLLKTKDRVFLYTREEWKKFHQDERVVRPTDYAIMCSAGYDKNGYATKVCRSADRIYCVDTVTGAGKFERTSVSTVEGVYCPVLSYDANTFVAAGHLQRIKENKQGGYHTVTLGLSFPTTFPGTELADRLTQLRMAGILHRLPVTYSGFYDAQTSKFVRNQAYKYNGEIYVRTQVWNWCDKDKKFSDGTPCPKTDQYSWAKVEPISWRIRNWDSLPQIINPKGTGADSFVELETEYGIMAGMSFYPEVMRDAKSNLWQNSLPRAYFNSYDLKVELDQGNGNLQYKDFFTYDYKFAGKGFLEEASQSAELLQVNTKSQANDTYHEQVRDILKKSRLAHAANKMALKAEKAEKPNPYGFTFEELDNDQLLMQYVESNTPVFLHGSSGVGKSGRVKQLDPTATRITLRPAMNPEEIDGILNRETGTYFPPLWYTQLCEKCQAEPERKHVLFMEELTNVKPTVQSLVYSIVYDRAGKDGLWPLPDNAVVVAAGNESADNLAAYPLTNALFRRFSHIYYEVDQEKWLDWATEVNKVQQLKHSPVDKTPRARIHPAIVAYIQSRGKGVLNQDLDEENPHIVTDPRKWEIASNVLYATKNPNALQPAIGKELTADFTDFVQKIQLTVDDVVHGRYDKLDCQLTMDVSSKWATATGLCMASEKDLPIVRQFILDTMSKEILATFDALWVRNDPERAAIIAECNLNLDGGQEHGVER